MENILYMNEHTNVHDEGPPGLGNDATNALAIDEYGHDNDTSKDAGYTEVCMKSAVNGGMMEVGKVCNTPRNEKKKILKKWKNCKKVAKKQTWQKSWKYMVCKSQYETWSKTGLSKQKSILDQANLRVTYELRLEAAYLKDGRRGPIGAIRNVLRKGFPSWAILGHIFPGGSVLDVITDRSLKDRLIVAISILGTREVPSLEYTLWQKEEVKSSPATNTRERIKHAWWKNAWTYS